jgi:hypothetical protein
MERVSYTANGKPAIAGSSSGVVVLHSVTAVGTVVSGIENYPKLV